MASWKRQSVQDFDPLYNEHIKKGKEQDVDLEDAPPAEYPTVDEASDELIEFRTPQHLSDLDLEAFTEELSEAIEETETETESAPDSTTHFDLAWQDLPISPLMDPGFIAAQKKPQIPKLKPLRLYQTGLQKILEKNPYAMALATPLRRCPITNVYLPRFFLQNFGLLGHPKTGDPFYVPRGWYMSEYTESMKQIPLPDQDEEDVGIGEDDAAAEARAEQTSQTDDSALKIRRVQPLKPSGPGMYTLSRYPLLQAIQSKEGGFGNHAVQRLIPPRIREKPAALAVFNRAEFRSDMPDFILELARKSIVDSLLYLLGLKRGYVRGCNTWVVAKWRKQTGAYLWMGETSNASEEPPEFATVEVGNRQKIPVYNLKVLLGEEKLDLLRRQTGAALRKPMIIEDGSTELRKRGVFDHPIIAVNHRNVTAHFELQLWWLQGYLATHAKFLGLDDTKNVE
jgi:hypothetical protein